MSFVAKNEKNNLGKLLLHYSMSADYSVHNLYACACAKRAWCITCACACFCTRIYVCVRMCGCSLGLDEQTECTSREQGSLDASSSSHIHTHSLFRSFSLSPAGPVTEAYWKCACGCAYSNETPVCTDTIAWVLDEARKSILLSHNWHNFC